MKFYYTLPLLLAGMFALAGCSSTTTEQPVEEIEKQEESESTVSEKTEVESKEEHTSEETTTNDIQLVETNFESISFVLPEDALPIDVGEQPLPVLAVFLNPATATNLNVVAEPLVESMSVEEYIDYVIAITGVEFVSNETYNSDGLEWNETVREMEYEAGLLQLIQRTFIHNNTAYIFSYSGSSAVIDNELELFNTIWSSVTIVE